jgi:two-component system, cell cycle sensor histidine kinase and response regulator CckA
MPDRPVSPNRWPESDEPSAAAERAAALSDHPDDRESIRVSEVLEKATDGFFAVDREWRFIYVNRQAAEVAGVERRHLLGRVLWDMFPQSAGTEFEALCRRALDEQVSIRYETYYSRLGAWFEAHICPDEDGLSLHFRDVSARKQVESRLTQRETLLSSLVDSVNGILWEADPATFQFSFVSHQAERILGYPTYQWLSERDFWSKHTHPDDVDWCTTFCLAATAERRDHDFEYRMIAADGRVVWLRDIVTVKIESDQSIRLQGIMIDVTAQKLAGEAALKNERKWRTIFDKAVIGIALVGPEGRLLESNPALRRMLDYTEEELRAMSIVEVTHPEDVAKDLALFEDVAAGRRTHYHIEKRYVRKDGQIRWANLIASVVPAERPDEILGVGMVEDITERKQLEEHLQHTQRMEAIGRLAGSVAHDFNNLLTAIIGFSSLVLASLAPDDPLHEEIGEIERAGKRAAALTGQLLEFSRKQAVQPRVLNLNAVLADNTNLIRRLVGEDVELVVDLAPQLGFVKADPGQIGQVVVNIAVNSRDAMPSGGVLSIRTSNVEVDAVESYPNLKPGSYVMLAVSDTGIGMSEDVQARVFEPFFTTKEAGKGTGLGLSTVYGIVKQSGGEVRVSSRAGIGTTFRVFLPFSEEVEREEEERADPPSIPRGNETVLLVEDEQAVRRMTRQMLEMSGYTVLEAASGSEAILIGERHDEPIHILVTDVVMPHMSGRELVDRMRQMRPELRVLYISGYTDDEIVHHGIPDASVDFLQKPFTGDDLTRRVQKVLSA